MKTAAPPLHVVATEGVRMTLADGRVLIDGIASWWTASHGYNHPYIVDAIIQQAQQMPHVMLGGIAHDQAMRLATRLAAMTLGDDAKVFFTESGSVAVEVALKIAVQYWMNCGKTDKKKFVCFKGAYHGDTSGAMAVCDAEDSMHSHFKGYLIEQYPHAIPETPEQQSAFESFVAERSDSIAGVIIEPLIQMAAGMRMHSAESLNFIYQVGKRHDILMIADEVATGFGRTGSLFAFNQTNFVPDILCLGKALTGGTTPLAATVATAEIYSKFHSDDTEAALMHGPTFMGHAIACAAANASLDLFETEPRLNQIDEINRSMQKTFNGLSDCAAVKSVRCVGAVGAVEVHRAINVGRATAAFADMGVFLRPIGNVVYVAPSFTINASELTLVCESIKTFVEHIE